MTWCMPRAGALGAHDRGMSHAHEIVSHPARPGSVGGLTGSLLRRWPTLLAAALAAASWDGDTDGYAVALVLLPTLYAVLLGVGRRGLTWPVLVLLLGGFVALRELTDLDPRPVLLVLAAAALGVSVVHGRGRREVLLQTAGVVGFGGAALLAAVAAPQVAVWLVAAGWFGHGVWDFVHLYRDRVVSRSFAEWCGVLDVLVAAELVLVAAS